MDKYLEKGKREGYLFDENIYKSLGKKARKNYVELSLNAYPIKFAMRTLNYLLKIEDLDTFLERYLEDLETGVWVIDPWGNNRKEVIKTILSKELKEVKEEMILFCLEWSKS